MALAALPADARACWPLRRLVERAGLASISPLAGSQARLRGANTLEERDALLCAFVERAGCGHDGNREWA
jgi:molybdopterin-guanine dinucleotide biosynthesis protein A